MANLLDEAILIGLLASTLQLATPILLASIGELFGQSSGVLNLGVEGMMAMGAVISLAAAVITGNAWLGLLSGMIIGGLFGLLMAVLSVTLGVNQSLSGLSIFWIGQGLAIAIYFFLAPLNFPPLGPTSIPLLSQVPYLGPILFQQNILVYLMLILAPISALVLYQSNYGLKIRAIGENPKAADTLGVKVYRTRYICVIFGGMMAGLAGAFLTIGLTGYFAETTVAGRGWIAVAIVYFGKWNPYRIVAGGLIFGGAFALQLTFQALSVNVPYQFLLMLPYVLTIIVLVMVGRKAQGPAAIGTPYKRG